MKPERGPQNYVFINDWCGIIVVQIQMVLVVELYNQALPDHSVTAVPPGTVVTECLWSLDGLLAAGLGLGNSRQV